MRKGKIFLQRNLMLFSVVFVFTQNHFSSHPWPTFHAVIVTVPTSSDVSLKSSSKASLSPKVFSYHSCLYLSLLSLNIYSNRYRFIVSRYHLL